jgi:heat shock protein HtpX
VTGRRPGAGTVAPVSTATTTDLDLAADRVVRALAVFGVLPGMVVAVVLALLFGPLVGLAGLVVVAGLWVLLVVLRAKGSFGRVLAGTGARRLEAGGSPRWENVVDAMGVTSGVSDPELWLIDRPEANALAVADRTRVALVTTTGLVEALGPVELEAVAANLLGRVKDGSARYGTVTVGLLGPFLGKMEPAGRLVADGLGDQRSVHSDLAAVGMTRFPPGLAAAWTRLEQLGTVVPGVDPATAHLWVAPVTDQGAAVDPAVAETAQQPLAYRIALLQEL